ncbi:uncharacterized protein C16orf52 homolog A isoform X3 [Ceratitis capitata]|uniref:uncharacterized protein C16orf52 homolog A isoform X3 n=1 Tax=Ceratitis capitata TaxID=7213 RepID=UPI000A0FEF1E|nr:uncharacterized protein C16orf52 homolog A isoform X3 [Ceratitis capitata]
MDKLTTISATLFLAADVFAIVSLAMPDWIVTEEAGDIRLGLMWTCMTLYNRSQVCYTPELQPEWFFDFSTTSGFKHESSEWQYTMLTNRLPLPIM